MKEASLQERRAEAEGAGSGSQEVVTGRSGLPQIGRPEHYGQVISYSESDYPAPEELKAYEEVAPEAAREVIRLAARECEARWQQAGLVERGRQRTALLGYILAFATVVILAFAGHSVLENGDVTSGIALTGTSLLGLIMAFLQNRDSR